MEIRIDDSTFTEVAEILTVINGGIVGSAANCETMMRAMTAQYAPESTYFGTAGFYIVCFDDDGIRYAKAVLMPYSVKRFLQSKELMD